MSQAKIRVETMMIPTYPNPEKEEMPIFAENRNHQRSSGDIYPNKIHNHIQRENRVELPYKAVILENDYIEIIVLPEIGGRVFGAKDKKTGYDFLYRQHVIKPALIGCLGAWISGGIEFNWPYHHKASGFLPCDFNVEECEDGSVICWVYEHDPVDRMHDSIGLVLRPDANYLETRVKVTNRTAVKHSFLWWENAAAPANKDYQLFFPKDVTYVNFHYLDSRTYFPISGDVTFNGIDQSKSIDISMHKNTIDATSYFAAASDYDFFGGYDHGKKCGVVHIGDHHITPGKKMFTWGYGQLSRSWEKALTDEDGQYCELMAGSYTDNQPNFSWLDAYETKEFSQYWYPITQIGSPDFANIHCALRFDTDKLLIEATEQLDEVKIVVKSEGKVLLDKTLNLETSTPVEISFIRPDTLLEITITSTNGKKYVEYKEEKWDELKKPPVKDGLPKANEVLSADELYLAGVHVDQYRDNITRPDVFWLEAIKRNPNHALSLIGLARYNYNLFNFEFAKEYIERAIKVLTKFNERLESGEPYYLYALILEELGEDKKAYDYFNKAAWSNDCVIKAMVHIASMDMKNSDYEKATEHAKLGYRKDDMNPLLPVVLMLTNEKEDIASACLKRDPGNLLLRYLSNADKFFEERLCECSQSVLDMTFDLTAMGKYEIAEKLIEDMIKARPDQDVCMIKLTLAWIKSQLNKDLNTLIADAEKAQLGDTYPIRKEELKVLRFAIEKGSKRAKFLLGCLLYNKRHYEEANDLWEEYIKEIPNDYMGYRCAAIAYFSHLNDENKAYSYMKKAIELKPDSDQLAFEMITLMDKLSIDPKEKIAYLLTNPLELDNLNTEICKAYNQANQADKALDILNKHNFIPCEGGESAIGDQWYASHYILGTKEYKNGNYEKAAEVFQEGIDMPDRIGSGVWNRCRLIPLQFKLAETNLKLGKIEEANEFFNYCVGIEIEFFSNMHLPELCWYQARAYDHLGMHEHAKNKMNNAKRLWNIEINKKDNGFFANTPFLMSFVDDPARMRKAYYSYLLGLVDLWDGRLEEAKTKLEKAYKLNTDNLYAKLILEDYFN